MPITLILSCTSWSHTYFSPLRSPLLRFTGHPGLFWVVWGRSSGASMRSHTAYTTLAVTFPRFLLPFIRQLLLLLLLNCHLPSAWLFFSSFPSLLQYSILSPMPGLLSSLLSSPLHTVFSSALPPPLLFLTTLHLPWVIGARQRHGKERGEGTAEKSLHQPQSDNSSAAV